MEQENYKPEFQPWNEEEFRADPYVSKVMNPKQRSLYKNLLQQMFFASSRPRLLHNDEELWLFADAENLQEWLDNKEVVLKKFRVVEGLLENKRVLDDWNRMMEKRQGLHVARSEAGRRGGLSSGKQRQAKKSLASSNTANEAKVSEVKLSKSEDITCAGSSTVHGGDELE